MTYRSRKVHVCLGLLALGTAGVLLAGYLYQKQASTDMRQDCSTYVVEAAGVTLQIPDQATTDGSPIAVSELPRPKPGSIRTFEFSPHGMTFSPSARVNVDVNERDLPPGTSKESLRLAVLQDGQWKFVDSRFNPDTGRVEGEIEHFSTYGIVPEPGEVNDVGTLFELNGISVESSQEIYARLSVTPEFIMIYVGEMAGTTIDLTISGLPADEEHYVYVDSHDAYTSTTTGSAVLSLDLDSARLLWVEPHLSTLTIGGTADDCGIVGVREGNTCRLTTDVVGEIEIGADSQILDCDGHYILTVGANAQRSLRSRDHGRRSRCPAPLQRASLQLGAGAPA